MTEIKHLNSPFALVPSEKSAPKKQMTRPLCRCDDEDDDFGMAPECAFICNWNTPHGHSHRKTSYKNRGTEKGKGKGKLTRRIQIN